MGISIKVVFKMASGIVKVGSSKHPTALGLKAHGFMERSTGMSSSHPLTGYLRGSCLRQMKFPMANSVTQMVHFMKAKF